MEAPRLLFADARGVVYDHPSLLAAARSGDDVLAPAARPEPLPEGSALCVLPGRRPIGVDPASGELVTLREAKVGRRTFVPLAVGATLPPGWTRALLPAAGRPPLGKSQEAPVLPQWAYTAAALGERGPVVYAFHTDLRAHWSPSRHSTPDLRARVAARLAHPENGRNAVWRQIARCALEWRCFTAQNTFYGRDEGAVPSSAACNASCVGCLSEQADGMPPASHERIARPPSPEDMAELAAEHLATARGRVMVSFGQGCEGEPLLRWREIARAIHLVRARTRRGSINVNTNGSLPEGLAALLEAGLDACRVSLNSASEDLYAAYYRPAGYRLADVVRSMKVAKERGAYLSLNLLTFPGVTDREEEAERLWRLVAEVGADQVQTRSLAIDPDVYMAVARGRGGRGPAIGVQALLQGFRRARPGLVLGNFARGLGERAPRGRGARTEPGTARARGLEPARSGARTVAAAGRRP